jgi:hypothetical protein
MCGVISKKTTLLIGSKWPIFFLKQKIAEQNTKELTHIYNTFGWLRTVQSNTCPPIVDFEHAATVQPVYKSPRSPIITNNCWMIIITRHTQYLNFLYYIRYINKKEHFNIFSFYFFSIQFVMCANLDYLKWTAVQICIWKKTNIFSFSSLF